MSMALPIAARLTCVTTGASAHSPSKSMFFWMCAMVASRRCVSSLSCFCVYCAIIFMMFIDDPWCAGVCPFASMSCGGRNGSVLFWGAGPKSPFFTHTLGILNSASPLMTSGSAVAGSVSLIRMSPPRKSSEPSDCVLQYLCAPMIADKHSLLLACVTISWFIAASYLFWLDPLSSTSRVRWNVRSLFSSPAMNFPCRSSAKPLIVGKLICSMYGTHPSSGLFHRFESCRV
mmetsp:Transcript_51572/g.122102  ORF Transcript_51572/g.122102 Transcript_51572/m.122102 type:complete len:231 (-) Transcript_51572:800-1492(-)